MCFIGWYPLCSIKNSYTSGKYLCFAKINCKNQADISGSIPAMTAVISKIVCLPHLCPIIKQVIIVHQNFNAMSLVKWNPETSLFPAFPNWMDDFFADNAFPAMKTMSMPAVNISETKKAFKLSVAAPGFKKDDFKVQVKDGLLIIAAEVAMEKEDKDEKFTRKEYAFNSFSRSFTLPETVKGDDILAEYKDGELKVTLPKKNVEEKPTMQIAVK